MAAYFTGGGAGTDVVQAAGTDGLQTLYLMNPSYVGFTDAATAPGGASNVMFLNSTVSTLTPARFGHHHQQPTPAAQHFVGIPLQPAPHSGYNLWGPDTTGAATGNDVSPPRHGQQQAPAAGTSAAVAAVSPVLSLSSREAAPPVTVAAAAVPGVTEHEQQVVMRSRYLKAAQELLDEAVSVSKGATAVKKKEDSEGGVSGGGGGGGGGGGVDDGGDSKSGGVAAEMSTAERQELQMKKSKLLNMLDEVEQRYRQYHRQMQAVAAAFEAAAGAGSARTYTSLALRTISRQFRCLRDAIAAQVRAASRGLGEDCGDEDGSGGRTTVGSRLRFIDSQLRQQRAMQQLGMVHAAGGGGGGGWRPQRGLPERAVSVLRAWLFEHFLHPYPKDSDKVMLAKQTGLTRSQVSNWFINARVRLWKPMVEEMYAEETKAKEEEEHDAAATAVTGGGSNDSVAEQPPDKPESAGIGMSSSPAATTSRSAGVHAGVQQTQASFYGGGGVGGGDAFQCRIKKARTTADEPTAAFHVSDEAAVSHRELLMKFMEAGGEGARGHPGVIDDDDDDVAGGNGGYSLFTPAPYVHQFGSEHFAFAGHGGGGVSLTLGLPHGADQTPASFLMGASTGGSDGGAPVTTAGYDMNMQSTKSLAAQLMRDFVA